MLFMFLVSFFQLPQHFIGVLFFVFLSIFGALSFNLFCFLLSHLQTCVPIVIQIGMVILLIENPLLIGVFFLVIHLYHGRA